MRARWTTEIEIELVALSMITFLCVLEQHEILYRVCIRCIFVGILVSVRDIWFWNCLL